jgi:cytoskeletal protein CcmA (bactofilin family)
MTTAAASRAEIMAEWYARQGRSPYRYKLNKEVDMLSSFKGKTEKDKNGGETVGRVEQPQRSLVERAAARPESTTKARAASCIGSDMSIVGNIACNGPAQVFGRIEGEFRASDLLIGDGAQVEGNVIAQEVTVCGRVKGTIRAVRVRLRDGGAVEGDIFHRSLSIDENSLFEGSSRRVENPTEQSPSANGPQKEDTSSPAGASLPSIDADLQGVESSLAQWSETTVEPKH